VKKAGFWASFAAHAGLLGAAAAIRGGARPAPEPAPPALSLSALEEAPIESAAEPAQPEPDGPAFEEAPLLLPAEPPPEPSIPEGIESVATPPPAVREEPRLPATLRRLPVPLPRRARAPEPAPPPRTPEPPAARPPLPERAGGLFVAARPTRGACPPPAYPEEARLRGVEGRAILRLSIDATGRVASAELVESSGSASLDAAALDAARGWRFEPATLDGRPCPSSLRIPVRFVLSS